MSHVGPCELLVVIFPGQETPACATAVLHAVDMSEGVRTVDAIMVVKDGVGRIRGDDLCEPPSPKSPNGHRHGGVADAIISAADIGEIGVLLTPHSSALALMIEHTWIHKPMEAVRDSGGALVAAVRIPVRSGR